MQKKFSKRITVLFLALCFIILSYCLYRNINKAIQPRQQEVQIQEKNEKKVYPNLANYSNVSILVSIKQQKMPNGFTRTSLRELSLAFIDIGNIKFSKIIGQAFRRWK